LCTHVWLRKSLQLQSRREVVVESVGTEWKLWIDGEKTLSQTHKHADCDTESINFIAFGPFMLDDIVVEELPRE
jgi:hypothetical protein